MRPTRPSPTRIGATIAAGVLSCVVGLATAPYGAARAAAAAEVDFARDIKPIFLANCVTCHGPTQQEGGLRLDARIHAVKGGDTGRPILGGVLETNEIYRRVSSADEAYRMPKRSETALAPAEIEAIKQWVEAGAPWPDATPPATALNRVDEFLGKIQATTEWLDRLTEPNPWRWPMAYCLLAGLFAFAAIERVKRRHASIPEAERSRVGRFCDAIGQRHFVAFCLALGALFVGTLQQGWIGRLNEAIAAQETETKRLSAMLNKTIDFGDPPVPYRPNHGRALTQVYYRGNCERSHKLFNYGNYCTAVFTIELRDETGERLRYGDRLPKRGAIHFDLERPPLTTPELYKPDIIGSVFLSETHFDQQARTKRVAGEIVTLSVEKEDWKWSCDFPLAFTSDKAQQGSVYVHTGRPKENPPRGNVEFRIHYHLVLDDEGKLADASEIWMGCLHLSAAVDPPSPAKRIPFAEWFDTRPIPFIDGSNSTDPKLLGTEEHQKNPLFNPPKSNEPESPPAPDSGEPEGEGATPE